jgi:hypothetical protein
MKSRRSLYLVVPALVACGLGTLGLRPHTPAAPAQPAAAVAPAPAATARAARSSKPAERAARARYHLTSEHRAFLNEKESAAVVVEGTWTTTERTEGRTEVQLAATRIAVLGDTPPAVTDVAEPFVMVKESGRLASLGFPQAMPGKARDLLSSLSATFQCSERPGDGAWKVEEQDLTGKYEAAYVREGDKLTRQRGRYLETRGPRGLEAQQGDAISSVEDSQFVFDARGLVRATVKLTRTSTLGKGMPSVMMVLRATLVREDVAEVAPAAGPDLSPEPITSHVDHAAIARKRNEKLVAGAKAPELIDAVRSAAHLDRKAPDTDKQRALALRRVSALVQLDGAAARDVAAAIRKDPSDQGTVGLLAGALASAPTPEATGALASLLDAHLPDEARSTVLADLALAAMPTAESAGALTRALDKPLGGQAALALGAEAQKLGEDDAGSAVEELVKRYKAATTPDEQRTYLQALANTASREALPVMLDALRGADFELARLGAFGLRLIPGDDVDDALWSLVEGGSPVVFEALKAAAYRSPALWQPRLEAAREPFAGQKRVLEQIQAILNQWSHVGRPRG